MKRFLGALLAGILILGSLNGCAQAEFEVGTLTIKPSQIVAGEEFMVSTEITNVGKAEGTYAATLTVDGSVTDTKEVVVGAGARVTVYLACIIEIPGTHNLELNGLSTTITTLRPAEFKVVSLSVPTEGVTGDPVAIMAEVTNVGEVEGTYTAALTINGTEVETKNVVVAPGVTEIVSFTLTEETPGSYTVALNGLTGLLEVLKMPSVDEVVAGMVAALEELTTWRSEFNMDMDIDISGPQSGHATMLMSGKGTIDLTDREMGMGMGMEMAVLDEETQEMQMATYCIVDTLYFMTGISGQEERWVKLTLPSDASKAHWETTAGVLSVSADMLETCNFELLSMAEAGGVPCYLLEGSPDMLEFFKLMPYQIMGPTQTPLFDVQEIFQGMFRDTKVSYWVARDSYNLIQSKMTASIFMDWGDEKIEGDMEYTQRFYDYGMEVHIELPPEAEATAEELLPVPAPAPVPTPTPEPGEFTDENLEAAIRDALGKPAGEPITPAELAGLTELNADSLGITDLSGIEHCGNLIDLSLYENQISDLSALSSLTSLTKLRLHHNPISDISALSSLTNLESLVLGNNHISDISPLASLTNLTWLTLYNNQISDLSPLASLTNLTILILAGNQISDLSPLASLTNLTRLNLQQNQVSDLSPLASLTKLSRLYLIGNQISDLSPLVENSGLGEGNMLWLGKNNLDLSEGSEDLENIRQLQGRGVVVHYDAPPAPAPVPAPAPTATETVTFPDENLEAAIRGALGKSAGAAIIHAELAQLTELVAAKGGITDLSGIEYCTNLTSLNLWRNQISDISPLASLTNLTYLSVQSNQISDISPLASLTNLTTLDLIENQISDISPLASLTNLRWLGLSGNQISDISPLASLTNLTTLDLIENQIIDLSPLASLTKLIRLFLQQNQIIDLSPLASLTKLTMLNLSSNQISDISPLVENSGLGEGNMLWLGKNNLDLSEGSEDLENIRQLQGRGVTVDY